MIKKQEFQFLSNDGIHKIKCIRWEPEQKEIKGILQIAHGMVEHIDRYDHFARFMCKNGFIVVGNDHLGHGSSVDSEAEWGFFGAQKGGFFTIVKDMHKLRLYTEQQYPDIPYFLLGHSMGSFLARIYITQYAEGLSGTIIMGTANQPPAIARLGKVLTLAIGRVRGWTYRSQLINSIAFGSYNKGFAPARTPYDWLTKDEAIIDIYMRDKRCTFIFTVAGYRDLFDGLIYIARPEKIDLVPKNLPVYFVAGADDPVGESGKGVKKVCELFKQAGIAAVDIKLYENDRHEILNETDKETVYQDILDWLEAIL